MWPHPADLYLTGFGSDRVKAMAIIRELIKGTLSDAKLLVENCPSLIQERLYRIDRRHCQVRIDDLLERFDSDAAFEFVVNTTQQSN